MRTRDFLDRHAVIQNLLADGKLGLDHHQRWPKSVDREALQCLRLVQLDVDRQEIDLIDGVAVENVVERCGLGGYRLRR